MSASVVVGYTATSAGADAITLGARLARALGGRVQLVIVLPREGTRSAAVPPERPYEDHLRRQAQEWLREGAATIPADIPRSAHVRFAESFAEGLSDAADEFGAAMLVVGAANGGLFGRHRLGSVATTLLHSSPVAVALAPAGLAENADIEAPVTRVTAAIGTRQGADVLLETAVAVAIAAKAPLRLVSLVTIDAPAGLDTAAIRLVGADHADEVLARAQASLPADLPATVETAAGESIEEAVEHLDWRPGELALVGSSRLAQPRRLFLGSTAAKMLHELPVPMIVVPRERTPEGA